jgi:hypothetical protein
MPNYSMTPTEIAKTSAVSIYELPRLTRELPQVLLASTEDSRRLCNDPFVVGVDYTRRLQNASKLILSAIREAGLIAFNESTTTVLHILRGGLNFGLREALHDAWGWNVHNSAFVSAQRRRNEQDPDRWEIIESAYSKVHLHESQTLIFGDVVGTGTSLDYALTHLIEAHIAKQLQIKQVLFFTIGTEQSLVVAQKFDQIMRAAFPTYTGMAVVMLEGIFAMARPDHNLKIKITGTDLLRGEGTFCPEFIASQSEEPCYALERCAIYDAGSRAFDVATYIADVHHYWRLVQHLAEDKGVTYLDYRNERMPNLEMSSAQKASISQTDLAAIARKQLEKVAALKLPVVRHEAD